MPPSLYSQVRDVLHHDPLLLGRRIVTGGVRLRHPSDGVWVERSEMEGRVWVAQEPIGLCRISKTRLRASKKARSRRHRCQTRCRRVSVGDGC